MSKKNNLLVAASGTGGHIFPALAVSKEVEDEWNIHWLGIQQRLDANFIPQKYNLKTLNIKTPRKNIFLFYQYIKILMSTFQIIRILKEKKINLVFTTGGYISAPTIVASKLLRIPVIIHCRDAADVMIKICSDLNKKGRCPRGVLHCWTGTPNEMKQFLDLGFYISFSGIVTFPKAHEIHECAKIVPCDRYLIETDSPFLAPVPHRGKRNEPAFVENVANFLSKLRSTELINIAAESSRNAEDLFKFNLINRLNGC